MPFEDPDDWRLEAAPSGPSGPLEHLLAHLRTGNLVREARSGLPGDVVLTHDGKRVFGYASSRASIELARAAIGAALAVHGVEATQQISRWDPRFDEWSPVDPPADAATAGATAERHHDEALIETRTLVADVGREIRSEFEQSLRNYATELGVECETFEHPHLLNAQVAFHATGPRHKLDEFAAGLRAEERATTRTERAVMMSPL